MMIMANYKISSAFIRPPLTLHHPQTSQVNGVTKPSKSLIRNILDLVAFDAVHNPEHVFCLQQIKDESGLVKITFKRLAHLVDVVSAWLLENSVGKAEVRVNGEIKIERPAPVALLMGSDIGIFTHMLALMKLGIPVALFSARLSPTAIAHLITKIGVEQILTTSHTARSANSALELMKKEEGKAVRLIQTESVRFFLEKGGSFQHRIPPIGPMVDEGDRNAIILHSSGSTGLPKPIYHTHKYLLGYAACHEYGQADDVSGISTSTLPLFHGFGMLPPGLSLSIGKPFALPASSTLPNGESTIDLLRRSGSSSLYTVPSILEDLSRVPDHSALVPLDFVAVGGGPMKHSVAETLSSEGVRLLNHCGATEIGALAPIFNPGPDYDWRYFVARQDLGLRFENVPEEPGCFKLVGRPFGWDQDFVVQDFLRPNPDAPERQFQFYGRADDLIVLGTGEKVRPTILEAIVAEDAMVNDCITFGEGREHLGLLVEADPKATLDLKDDSSVARFIDNLWPVVERGNEHIDTHGKISKDMVILTHPSSRPLERTAKGSLARKEIFQSFAAEIKAAYEKASPAAVEPLPDPANTQALTEYLRNAVYDGLGLPIDCNTLALTDDLFDFGLNSLQASRLVQRLAASAKSSTKADAFATLINRNFVYSYPTISSMIDALKAKNLDESIAAATSKTGNSRTDAMLMAVDKYSRALEAIQIPTDGAVNGMHSIEEEKRNKVVILTGSTGGLGSNILAKLAEDPGVSKIHSLNRKSGGDQAERQNRAFAKAGLSLPSYCWSKIHLLEVTPQQPQFGLSASSYEGLKHATHIIHNAWPMDFNRMLLSFDAQFQYLASIIELVLSNPNDSHPGRPPRVLFTSSIAAVANYDRDSTSSSVVVPEEALYDPSVTAPFGYPEAKWVCERILQEAGTKFPGRIDPLIVRVGQLTGATNGKGWATTEHLPSMFKSSVSLGALPNVPGTFSWTPVDVAAAAAIDILFQSGEKVPQMYHLENPNRQQWKDMCTILSRLLPPQQTGPSERCLPIIPFADWLRLVQGHDDTDRNPARRLIKFLEEDFMRLGTGKLSLDTRHTLAAGGALVKVEIGEELVERYIEDWRGIGFV